MDEGATQVACEMRKRTISAANLHGTWGSFSTPTLMNAIAEVGVERIMFSAQYPFEDIQRRGPSGLPQCSRGEAEPPQDRARQ